MLGYTQSVPASQPHYVSKAKASLTFFEAGDTIDSGRYTIRYKIGTGAFGTVYHAVDRVGRSFAIKTLLPEEPLPAATEGKRSARKIPRRTLVQRFSEEATAHATVTGHPSIVRLHRTFMALGRCYFVFDLHGGGTLLNAITEQGLYWNDDEAITSAFTQLIDAVAHCHRRGVAHRDLKPDNILISSDGRSYYLADFGLATMDRQCDQFGAGSKHYKSPECIGTEFVGDTYGTHAADVWSLGIILINMITGGHPWNRAHTSDPNFAAYIFERSHLSNVLPLSPRAAILLSRTLDPDVRTRITLPELKVEARRVVRWGLDDAELACASDAARASVLSYARTLNMPYVLPPAVRVEPRKFAPSARRTHAVPSAMERQNAFLPPQTSVFDTESIMRPSSSTITVDSQSPATSIMVELPEPPSTPKRDSGKRGSVFRSLRKLKAWAW